MVDFSSDWSWSRFPDSNSFQPDGEEELLYEFISIGRSSQWRERALAKEKGLPLESKLGG